MFGFDLDVAAPPRMLLPGVQPKALATDPAAINDRRAQYAAVRGDAQAGAARVPGAPVFNTSQSESQMIAVDGVSDVNFVRTGPRGGRPLVFLHPVGLDLTWWGAQVEDFGRDHDVVAFDLPNHGLSGTLNAPPSFELLAKGLEGVLAHLDTGPVHVVGMSIGGMIAQQFALQRPDLVCSLSLVATLCTFPASGRKALRERARVARARGMHAIAQLSNARWFPPAFRERRPDVLDRATQSLVRQDSDFHASMWEMIAALDLEARLPSITCPTLVVIGGADVNAPIAAGEQIAGLIAGASLRVMAGVGHFPAFEAPGPFNDLLRRFLASPTADGPAASGNVC